MPTISVIIPVYRVEKYLQECIDSVLQQEFDDIEVILVDDGSPDRCGEICDEYAKRDYRVVVIHQENSGLSCARNAGIAKATGRYLMFLDSDDYIAEECLTEISAIIKEKNVDVIIGRYILVPEEGAEYQSKLEATFDVSRINGMSSDESINYILRLGPSFFYMAWRFIVKRELVIYQDLYFYEGIYHEDEEWTPRLLCCANSFWLYEQPFYHYRIRAFGSITSKFEIKHYTDRLIIVDSLTRFLQFIRTSTKEKLICSRIAILLSTVMFYSYTLDQKSRRKIRNVINANPKTLSSLSKYNLKILICIRVFGDVRGYYVYYSLVKNIVPVLNWCNTLFSALHLRNRNKKQVVDHAGCGFEGVRHG